MQPPTGDAGPSSVVLQRLEQRLDAERRTVERQHKHLERRLEEFIGNCPQLGKLAELQGHVDGLNEAVQELAHQVHDGSSTNRSQHSSRGDNQLVARVAGIDGRLNALESRQTALEDASAAGDDSSLIAAGGVRSRQAKACDDVGRRAVSTCSCAQDLGPRTARLESLVESLGSWDSSALDALQRQTATMSTQMADVVASSLPSGRGSPAKGSRDVASLREQLAVVQDDVARLTGRSQSFESQLRQVAARGASSVSQAPNGADGDSNDLLDIKEQLEQMYRDLIGRVQDMEQRMSCASASPREAPYHGQHALAQEGEFDELLEHQAAEHRGIGLGASHWPSVEPGHWPEGLEGSAQDNLSHLCREVAHLASRVQEVETGGAVSRDVRQLAAEVQSFSERLLEVERGLEDVAAGHEEGLEDQVGDLCEQLADLRADVDEQVGEIGARVRETERGLHDVAQAQDVQRQAHRVGERVLGLSLRMQRAEQRGGSASRWAAEGLSDGAEECAALREELDTAGEALVALRSRVQASEHGLEGVAEAFDRVCEELAELRGRAGDPRLTPMSQEDTSRLHAKVRELELALGGGGEPEREAGPEEDGQGLEHAAEVDESDRAKLAPNDAPSARNSASELRSRLREMDGELRSGTERVVWALAEVVCDVARSHGKHQGAPAI